MGMETDSGPGREAKHTPFTARDLSLLEFAGQHRLILASHAQSLLGVSTRVAQHRLRRLQRNGYVVPRRVFAGHPACYQITREGLAAIGSSLPPPRLDLRAYVHDVGVAWLWLGGRHGAFGPLKELLSERTLRSEDGRWAAATRAGLTGAGEVTDPTGPPYGVRLGGLGSRGRERLHYPDLLLTTQGGRRIAVELELTSKGPTRRQQILTGYGSDGRVGTVLYLVDRPSVGRAIEASARRLGIASLVQVQRVRQTLPAPGQTTSRSATRATPERPRGAESRGGER